MEIRQSHFDKGRQFPHQRIQRVNRIKNIVIAVTMLLLVLLVGGVVYTWYVGQHPLQSATQTVDTSSIAPKIKTYTPAPDANIGIVQQTFTATAAPGDNASISIKTNPGAACQISVKANNQYLPDTGLTPKVADEFGIVDWSWSVPKGVLPGSWPVEITCANAAKKSAYYKVDLTVTR